jgi:hypothetical protein
MNKWYSGHIDQWPVEVFLSDDYSMDYYLSEEYDYPPQVIEACEGIRATDVRSLKGCQKALASFGWANV